MLVGVLTLSEYWQMSTDDPLMVISCGRELFKTLRRPPRHLKQYTSGALEIGDSFSYQLAEGVVLRAIRPFKSAHHRAGDQEDRDPAGISH